MLKQISKGAALVSGSLLATSQAFASVVPADFATEMTAVEGDLITVGGGLIGLALVAVSIRWVKAAFFG
jgi:hypothetical protein